jgi:hypothetical protein
MSGLGISVRDIYQWHVSVDMEVTSEYKYVVLH